MKEYLDALEKKYGLPQGLLSAQMHAESGGNPSAVSPKGALGAFQFMPDTAKEYGIDPLDPMQAAEGAARMNSDLIKKYGDVGTALAAYNWGQGNVDRKGLQNMPQETQGYVSQIMGKIGDFIVPSAHAEDVPPGFVPEESLKPTEKTQLIAELGNASDPSGFGAQPWSALHVPAYNPDQEEIPPGFVPEDSLKKDDKKALQQLHDQMYANVQENMGPDAKYFGVPAALTAYAANAMQTIPFSDEFGSATAAALGYGQGNTFKDRYDNLQQSQQALREAGAANNPGATALGQVGASLASLPLIPVGKQAGAKSLLGSIAKGAATGAKYGAGYGALFGLGDSDSFLPDDYATASRLENAKDSAISGSKLGAGIGAIAGPIGYKKTGSAAPVTAQMVKDEANKLYEASEQAGGYLKGESVNKWIDEATKVAPQTAAGKVIAGENAVTKLTERMQGLKDKPMSLQSAKEVYEGLGDQIDSLFDRTTGRLSKEGKKIFDIQTSFRNMIAEAPQNALGGSDEGFKIWKQAQSKWSEAMRLSDIERIMQRAETSDNPATAMRSGFKTLYNNPARMRGYNAEQRSLIKKAATANLAAETLRGLGSRLLSIMAFGSGHPELGLAAQGFSAAARSGAARVQTQRAQEVIDSITGAPKQARDVALGAAQAAQQEHLMKKRK